MPHKANDPLWTIIGQLLHTFSPVECQNYLANSGYASN
jgi:hypothetical protein